MENRRKGSGFRSLRRTLRLVFGGVVVLGVSTLIVVGCGNDSEPQAAAPGVDPATPPVDPAVAAAEAAAAAAAAEAPAEEVQVAAGEYSDAYDEVYTGMTPEQRQELAGEGVAAEEVQDLDPVQLAALSLANQDEADAEQVGENEAANDVTAELGQINMEDVSTAFAESADLSDFEQRLNQIYEGAHVVLVKVHNEGGQGLTEAWEDLDDSGTVDEEQDDQLFTITLVPSTRTGRLTGVGANGYYDEPLPNPVTGQLLAFLLGNIGNATYTYMTDAQRRAALLAAIQAHRASEAWRAQRRRTRLYYRRWYRNPRYRRAIIGISPRRRVWRRGRRVRIALPPPPRRMKIRRPIVRRGPALGRVKVGRKVPVGHGHGHGGRVKVGVKRPVPGPGGVHVKVGPRKGPPPPRGGVRVKASPPGVKVKVGGGGKRGKAGKAGKRGKRH